MWKSSAAADSRAVGPGPPWGEGRGPTILGPGLSGTKQPLRSSSRQSFLADPLVRAPGARRRAAEGWVLHATGVHPGRDPIAFQAQTLTSGSHGRVRGMRRVVLSSRRGIDTPGELEERMHPYDLDSAPLRLAREHAEELRTDWRIANSRGRPRTSELASPCGMSAVEFFRRAAIRLTELGRRPRLAKQDPCS